MDMDYTLKPTELKAASGFFKGREILLCSRFIFCKNLLIDYGQGPVDVEEPPPDPQWPVGQDHLLDDKPLQLFSIDHWI